MRITTVHLITTVATGRRGFMREKGWFRVAIRSGSFGIGACPKAAIMRGDKTGLSRAAYPMKPRRIPGRKFYASSGAVNWAGFVPLLLLGLVVSAAMAVFMHLLFRWGHYYVLIIPLLCALPVPACPT